MSEIQKQESLEIKYIAEKVMQLLGITDVEQFSDTLLNKLLSDDKNAFFDEYFNLVGDTERDLIQDIYSNLLADRKGLKQDYTPPSLSRQVAEIACYNTKEVPFEVNSCYDACAGSGSLTLQVYKMNPDCYFYLEELDTNVIPFLLFNLTYRNCNAELINGNILMKERYKVYKLKRNSKYSDIEVIECKDNWYEIPKTDIAISNPPFNLHYKFNKDKFPELVGKVSKGMGDDLFIMNCFNQTKENGRTVVIESCGLLFNNQFQNFREHICDNDYLDTLILNPDNMFENTAIPTITMFLNKKKEAPGEYKFIHAGNLGFFLKNGHTRYKSGSGDSKCHTNRVYEKKYNAYDDEHIEEILDCIYFGGGSLFLTLKEKDKIKQGYLMTNCDLDYIKQNDYNINTTRYESEPIRTNRGCLYKENHLAFS